MEILAVILVLAFAAYIYKNYWGRILKTRRDGIETEALVSRVEEEDRISSGTPYRIRNCYAIFRTEDGLENEVRLLNPKKSLAKGSIIRIRCLPGRVSYAVLTGIVKD